MTDGIRLQHYLSQAGVASRRVAERLISEGEVRVNGKVVTAQGTRVKLNDKVTVGGKRVLTAEKVYMIVNKPKGVVATMDEVDPEGRPTLRSLLPKGLLSRVVVVGGLDLYAEGVVLLTNDGALANALTHPSHPIPKTYQVKVKGKPTDAQLQLLEKGIKLSDGVTAPAEVAVLRDEGNHMWLQITTEEGRHRVIQRMLEEIGHEPLKLTRVAFAALPYYGLRIGEHRLLGDGEINNLRVLAGLAE